jgi:hypothetical protein
MILQQVKKALSGVNTKNRVATFFPAMLLGKIKVFIF